MLLTDRMEVRMRFMSSIRQTMGEANHSSGGLNFTRHVLGTLFYCYVSEQLTSYVNDRERERGNLNFNYAKLVDEEAENFSSRILREKGFFILPSELFENVRKGAANNKNLDETLTSIFRKIEISTQDAKCENQLKGIFAFLITQKSQNGIVRNEILVKLLDAIGNLSNDNDKNSITENFGDAFEYLVKTYADELNYPKLNKVFTPLEISVLLVGITVSGKKEVDKVYDPACGTGELLLQFAKGRYNENIRNGFFGQEVSNQTYNLCRINMILHNINCDQFDIACGDTLSNPYHKDVQPFEAIVSNPTYSSSWEGKSNPKLTNDIRFSPAGDIAPESNADWAFVMHSLAWLANNGTAAIVLTPRAMKSTGSEQRIRMHLVEKNYVDTVIRLPGNLYLGTSVAPHVLVLKKNKSDNKVLFIDAFKEVSRSSNENLMEPEHITKILNCCVNREEYNHFSRLIDNKEILENDCNISVEAYLEHEVQNIVNISELNAEIEEIVSRQSKFRNMVDTSIAEFQVGAV